MANHFSRRAQRIPPILVRLLAVENWKLMSDEEICKRSGLSEEDVHYYSRLTTWKDVAFADMMAFLRACNCDFESRMQMNRVECYLRRPTWKYLRKHPEWKTKFQPMLVRWLESVKKKK